MLALPPAPRRDCGGDEEDRTPDLRIANATLSQLSYVPTLNPPFYFVRMTAFKRRR
jgi:hypothetical protein